MMGVMADKRDEQGRRRRKPLEGSPADIQEVPGWAGRLMVWLRVAAQLAAIQGLLILGTLAGLVVAGLGPAAVSGTALLRRLATDDPSDALWRDFWREYRRQFRRAALVTAPLLLLVAVAWYEFAVLVAWSQGTVGAIMAGAVLAFGVYATTCLGYSPAVMRRYDDSPLRTLRFVAVAPLLSPLVALGCAVTVIAMAVIGARFLPLLILAGLSVPLLLCSIMVDRWLDKVDARVATEHADG